MMSQKLVIGVDESEVHVSVNEESSHSRRRESAHQSEDLGQHNYRIPELANAMKQTVSYGGCAISPMASYREIDVAEDLVDETKSSRNSSSFSNSKKYMCHFDGGNGKPNGRPHRLILRFDTSGNGTLQEMSRADVLRVAQEAAAPPKSTDVDDDEARDEVIHPARPVHAGRRGSRRFSDPRTLDCAKIVDVQRVHARDIRKLDNAFSVSNEPSIVVRKQAILVNADPLRAVIMRDACLVFVPDGADSLLQGLKDKFREYTQPDASEMAFELRALEAILATICRYFQADFDKTAPSISKALDRLARGNVSSGELEKLRVFKNMMNEFESQVDGIRRALMEFLDNEDDLRLLHLTKLFNDPSLLSDLFSFDSEEAEVLIENYLQDIFSTRTKANLMQHRIQNTESLVMLKLDSMRNYLLGVELLFSLVAISLSIGTYITGAFGMNLNSHIQNADHWFWGVVIFTLSIFVVLTASGVVFFRKKGVLI